MSTAMRRSGRTTATIVLIGSAAVVLAGCAGGGDSSSVTSGDLNYLSFTENETIANTLTALSTASCSAENEALPLKVTTQPQASFDQQLQLLAGQDALPSIFPAGNTPQVAKDLFESGQLVDVAAELDKAGVSDDILPAAASTITNLYGSVFTIPTEFNVEGIWYNKEILADNGIEAPATWDELIDAAATVQATGINAFSAAGKDGWPLTRLIGNYLFRTVGPDAMQRVADGDAKLTDPEYVAAAAAVADLGTAGYFGAGVGSIDYATALNSFISGDAAFFYMGSWTLADFNNTETNTLGADNIGFMAFPEVSGGSGSSDQLAANVGVPLALSEKAYNDDTAAWLTCIVENFGAESLNSQGVLTGFAVNGDVDVPPLTTEVQELVANAGESVLWFEALFNTQATTTSQTNAAQLVTGAITPTEFMELVQADLD